MEPPFGQGGRRYRWTVPAAALLLIACTLPAARADEPPVPPVPPLQPEPPAPAPAPAPWPQPAEPPSTVPAAPVPAEPPPAAPAPADPVPPASAPAPAPTPSAALEFDEVRLENGSVFRGTIVEEDATKVVLQRVSEDGGTGRFVFEKKRVSTIRRAGPRAQDGPSVQVIRDAWFLLRSGGETVGTRRLVLRSVRTGAGPGFRLEESVLQLPQGRRIPATRIERSEDTDARFLPLRTSYREAVEPAPGSEGYSRFERSVTGGVAGDVWTSVSRTGEVTTKNQVSLPPGVRAPLGLREFLLREERVTGVSRRSVLDPARDGLVDVDVGFASLGGGARPDELHWVEGGVRRVARIQGNEILEETLADGVVATPTTEAQARAAEANATADPASREVTLAEQGLLLTLPGPDWALTRPVASALDAGWRKVARLASPSLLADARVEWDPEGTPRGQTPEQAEAALVARLRTVCPDLAAVEGRRLVAGLPGAWRAIYRGTLRDTPVYTLVLCIPRGAGQTVVLAACPESSWALGRPVLERLVGSARGL